MGDMPWTHTSTHTEGKTNSLANPFGVRLITNATFEIRNNISLKWNTSEFYVLFSLSSAIMLFCVTSFISFMIMIKLYVYKCSYVS